MNAFVAFTNRDLNMIIEGLLLMVFFFFPLLLEKYIGIRCRQASPGNPRHTLGIPGLGQMLVYAC